mmetsp:Transcript_47435/g.118499  ORF Transcript_47435/g.118499 Transcript_47435/m.118499 type:complete len:85 (+) Transcript_47435:198-452(+)
MPGQQPCTAPITHRQTDRQNIHTPKQAMDIQSDFYTHTWEAHIDGVGRIHHNTHEGREAVSRPIRRPSIHPSTHPQMQKERALR